MYTSVSGKAAILALYDAKLAELDMPIEAVDIPTSFGQTHVLITGDPSHPPLVLVHGSNGCAPIALETYPHLYQQYRIYAVDVLAQPNKSAETRLGMKDRGYADWMEEVMAHFQLQSVRMLGFSLGGLIILKTLAFRPQRIKDAFLVAPAYIVNGNPIKALLQMFWPMRRYIKTQDPARIEQFLTALFTERDPFAVSFLPQVFLHFDMDFSPVPIISKAEAARIDTPITLIAAGDDLIFPGQKMIKRAQAIFPSLQETLLLPHSKHVQSWEDRMRIERLLMPDIKAPQ